MHTYRIRNDENFWNTQHTYTVHSEHITNPDTVTAYLFVELKISNYQNSTYPIHGRENV